MQIRQFSAIPALFLTLLATSIVHAQDEATTTTWTGTLEVGSTELRLEVDITASGENLSGEMRSLDQGNAKLKIDDVKVDDGQVSFKVPQIGATYSGELSEDGKSVDGTFTQSGMKLSLKLNKGETKAGKAPVVVKETLKEAWVGELDLGAMKPVMQFRIMQQEGGKEAAYFDSVTEGRTGFPADFQVDGDEVTFEVKEIQLKFVGKLNEAKDKIEGDWSQGGRTFPLTVEKKESEFENKNVWENRPQKPKEPIPYQAVDVSFENKRDDLILAGTLTLPKTEGPHPAVVLISGSGPQDRDETLMGHKPFLVIADYLTRRGIAVLRYDDRGTADSTGDFSTATTEDFAHDASAAVDFLAKHSKIDSGKIGLAGHSEGGLIAPIVCGLNEKVAFIVLMAGTGVDGKTIVISQSEAMARAESVEESEIELSQVVTKRVLELVMAGKLSPDSPELGKIVEDAVKMMPEDKREGLAKTMRAQFKSQIPQLQTPWMKYFLTYDPMPALTQVKCPTLSIIGSKDTQVLPELNQPMIRKALEGNDQASFVIMEGLNHLFQKCETGGMSEYAEIQETFNPDALKRIGDWIENVVK